MHCAMWLSLRAGLALATYDGVRGSYLESAQGKTVPWSPVDVFVMNARISSAVAAKDWMSVLELTDAVLLEDPDSLKAMEARALAFASLERYADALVFYEAVVRLFRERELRGLDISKPLDAALGHRLAIAARLQKSKIGHGHAH